MKPNIFTSNPMNRENFPPSPPNRSVIQMNQLESGNVQSGAEVPPVTDLKRYPSIFSLEYWSYCKNPEPGLVLDGISHKGKCSQLTRFTVSFLQFS